MALVSGFVRLALGEQWRVTGPIGAAAIVWLIVAQILAFGLGGYVAGRLRVKWATVHNDEVYFRDTAHGLLVWAVAAVVTAGVLATAAADMAGSARARDGARRDGGAMTGASPPIRPNMPWTACSAPRESHRTVRIPEYVRRLGGYSRTR